MVQNSKVKGKRPRKNRKQLGCVAHPPPLEPASHPPEQNKAPWTRLRNQVPKRQQHPLRFWLSCVDGHVWKHHQARPARNRLSTPAKGKRREITRPNLVMYRPGCRETRERNRWAHGDIGPPDLVPDCPRGVSTPSWKRPIILFGPAGCKFWLTNISKIREGENTCVCCASCSCTANLFGCGEQQAT